jgi:hypothetical protein
VSFRVFLSSESDFHAVNFTATYSAILGKNQAAFSNGLDNETAWDIFLRKREMG